MPPYEDLTHMRPYRYACTRYVCMFPPKTSAEGDHKGCHAALGCPPPMCGILCVGATNITFFILTNTHRIYI